ncbi:TetR/AcrR family transcriptional regulator [Demequina muriae]|uniref:TetR/AcrR family transcriptional regulator n=1 Tax=Demequina muriae TaxID=3051664 RepID=A0ABT8GG68_9MICO|nr:TetR/AcrR family transcriptional regulator [Demequina sp. EGI L300058]MDN4480423.1 TetR/AcrR family transcriptional regulator [Demequina sp. EGI L300058]
MPTNPRRRTEVIDAALQVLGREGSRGLTHRAVDRAATVPPGTCGNYYPRRADLMLAMAQRIFERVAPEAAELARLETVPDDEALPEYVAYVVERLTRNPDLARALIELRLEASRSPDVADLIAPFLRQGLRDDMAFYRDRGLPGDSTVVLMLHHVVNGVVLDHLTVPLDPASDPVSTARDATARLGASAPDVHGHVDD